MRAGQAAARGRCLRPPVRRRLRAKDDAERDIQPPSSNARGTERRATANAPASGSHCEEALAPEELAQSGHVADELPPVERPERKRVGAVDGSRLPEDDRQRGRPECERERRMPPGRGERQRRGKRRRGRAECAARMRQPLRRPASEGAPMRAGDRARSRSARRTRRAPRRPGRPARRSGRGRAAARGRARVWS